MLMFNGFRLPLPALKQAERISTTNRHAGLEPAAAMPEGRISSIHPAGAMSVLHDLNGLAAGAMRRFCPLRAIKSSACRGTPFQFAEPGELLPFAQGKPAFPPSFRLPPRHGARRPASPVELNAATRRLITPKRQPGELAEKPDIPLRGGRAPSMSRAGPAHIHPRFLPDPASRGTPLQPAEPGEELPYAQGKPAYPPSNR